jgi:hypothetical protein
MDVDIDCSTCTFPFGVGIRARFRDNAALECRGVLDIPRNVGVQKFWGAEEIFFWGAAENHFYFGVFWTFSHNLNIRG